MHTNIYLFTDLEGGSKLDAHGRHEVVGLEEHKGLPVNLLHHEVLHVVAAARQLLDEVANLSHGPPSNVHLCDGHNEYDSMKLLSMILPSAARQPEVHKEEVRGSEWGLVSETRLVLTNI